MNSHLISILSTKHKKCEFQNRLWGPQIIATLEVLTVVLLRTQVLGLWHLVTWCVVQNCLTLQMKAHQSSKTTWKLTQCHKVTSHITCLLSNTLQKPHISQAYTDSYSLKNNSRAHRSSWLVSCTQFMIGILYLVHDWYFVFSSWLVSCIQFMIGILYSVHDWCLVFSSWLMSCIQFMIGSCIQFMIGIMYSVHDWYLVFSSWLVSCIQFMIGILYSVHDWYHVFSSWLVSCI
jgi:hypothetical protein